MTEEQKTKNHYEMLNNSSNKALVDLIKMQDNKIEQLKKQNKELQNGNFVLTVNEIIEGKDKKIAELEKENAELKERNAELKGMYAHSAREAGTYKQFLEAKEKENAELKDALKGKRCNCMTYLNFKDLEKECAKAKEIISEYINILKGDTKNWKKTQKKAEQFLKECK